MYTDIESQSTFLQALKRLKLLESTALFYNPLDHCLNLNEFSLFLDIFGTLQNKLDA
jgi:hypothetical protein